MIHDSRFVIIAGTARNVGKTTLACEIIKKNSSKNITALKFVTLKQGAKKHNHHSDITTYSIIEEEDYTLKKDTVKMLNAGARRSFLIVSHEDFIQEAILEFLKMMNSETLVIAESATLRGYLKPKKFIIVDREEAINKKDYIKDLIPLADFVVNDIKDPTQLSLLINLT